LNGLDEESVNKPDKFSGVSVLKKIKEQNSGNQVIVFTASNKAWNMKALFDMGADGYYIKESPEYSFSQEFSAENYNSFKEQIEICLSRGYLRDIFNSKSKLLNKINGLTSSYPSDFLNELKNQLNLAYSMLYAADIKEKFAYAYVTLYMIIEITNKYFYTRIGEEWIISDVGNLKKWQWDSESKRYEPKGDANGNKVPEWIKFAGLYFQKWEQTNHLFIKNIYDLINKRNWFIHKDEKLNFQYQNGNYPNHDIYSPDGFIKLFESVEKTINFL
jgi:CheY-like chemotaxis protein